MLAQRISGILPPMDHQECLEATRVHSVAGTLLPNFPLLKNSSFSIPPPFYLRSGIDRRWAHSASRGNFPRSSRCTVSWTKPWNFKRSVFGRSSAADGKWDGYLDSGSCLGHLSGALHACGGDEPLPMRISWGPGKRMPLYTPSNPSLSGSAFWTNDGPLGCSTSCSGRTGFKISPVERRLNIRKTIRKTRHSRSPAAKPTDINKSESSAMHNSSRATSRNIARLMRRDKNLVETSCLPTRLDSPGLRKNSSSVSDHRGFR